MMKGEETFKKNARETGQQRKIYPYTLWTPFFTLI